jgi:hypothetical protein
MRKSFAAVTGVAFALTLGAMVVAKVETVKGELVDQACYMKDKVANVGAAHQECAQTCAKKGQPVALVTEDGKIYTVTGDLAMNMNAKLVPHMAHTVELTGDVTEKDGKMAIAATDLKMARK